LCFCSSRDPGACPGHCHSDSQCAPCQRCHDFACIAVSGQACDDKDGNNNTTARSDACVVDGTNECCYDSDCAKK
jgi:hypothetical protein